MKFFEDSSAPFEHCKHHGYYTVANKHYLYRYTAHHAANRKAPITWNFNDNVWSALDWSKPVNATLPQLYKERAQQLRDKYDYLILAFSGGPDSYQMLRAFTDNNIRLDEVWCDWPHGLMDKVNYKPNTVDINNTNLASEWAFTTEPKLRWLEKAHPEIKIHISDAGSIGEAEDSEDTWLISNFRSSYFITKRQRYIYNYTSRLYNMGKKVAVVYGVDKPTIRIQSNHIGYVFHDLPTIWKNDVDNTRFTNVEYFYWTPDMPYIVINQTNEMIRYLQHNPTKLNKLWDLMTKKSKYAIHRKHNMDAEINEVCYPEWDNAFQTDKHIYVFESSAFHVLLKPFIGKEKFLDGYVQRYYKDTENIDPELLFEAKGKDNYNKLQARVVFKFYPVMSLDDFYKGMSVK